MFKRILIANRGEIACRIIRTVRRMGIATVAVYSDADRDAPHVEMADQAVRIGPPPAAESYLSIETIVAACKQTAAEAVHPGYGFLSEREAFAKALDEAGIVFIGPNRKALAAMGDKIAAKTIAAKAKVSTVPGDLGAITDDKQAVRIAAKIGYPVMIKASAGGGGKGMRIARSADEVVEGVARARSEARSSFDDDRVFIEKFVENPRHIEVQVLGDKHGHIIHLGERECSIQRRHQKVVEESPSPAIDAEMRAKMGTQAVALAKMVGYDSAGTVEFVVGEDGAFYFLEMNTRLQVEHPVTELVTGIDLVEQMIRVAAGEKLAIKQSDVRLDGWAIETRIYAEDPYRNFLPSTGRLIRFRPPPESRAHGVTLRVDTGVAEGGEISRFYDPMIAKVITHASTRPAAIAAQADALDAFHIDGVRHNISFLTALMQHPRWQAGRLSTGFIDEEFPGGFHGVAPAGDIADLLTAVAAEVDAKLDARCGRISGRLRPARDHGARRRVVRLGDREGVTELSAGDAGTGVVLTEGHGATRTVALTSEWRPGQPVWRGSVNGSAKAVGIRPVIGGYALSHHGVETIARVYRPEEAAAAHRMPVKRMSDFDKAVRCPMPGLVISIDVVAGQEVKTGETLAVVEAMKMENVLRAERDGTVKVVKARPGDSLAVDEVILEFA